MAVSGERLSPTDIAAVAKSLEVNPHWRAAANYAGINEKTIYDYRNRAETYANRLPDLPEDEGGRFCYEAVQSWIAARNRLETRCVESLLRHGDKDWKAHFTILKALAPQDWSERVELTGVEGGPIQVDLAERAREAFERIAAKEDSQDAG